MQHSYRSYINDYRLQIIEKRLTVPTITLGQIADEFGFTDESHLNKFFKTHKGIGPKDYRSKVKETDCSFWTPSL